MVDNILMEKDIKTASEEALVGYISAKATEWRNWRDNNYKTLWDSYYRIWRGIWNEADKSRESERSRLISPATQQAIEVIVAELEEATFGKGNWFDLKDSVTALKTALANAQQEQQQQQKGPPVDALLQEIEQAEQVRDRLIEAFALAGIPQAIANIYLLGAIYGTGIGKILVEETEQKKPASATSPNNPSDLIIGTITKSSIVIKLEAVDPMEFLIDPAATTIENAVGVIHEVIVPTHTVASKMKEGIYREEELGDFTDSVDLDGRGEAVDHSQSGRTKISEYHGLVPTRILKGAEIIEDDIEEDYTEVVITIANDATLLRAIKNPFLMGDRSFIAYQHDTVPNRFYGRGIAEKAHNIQKALDAELRARIDGLALTVHPMMAADATRFPRGQNLAVHPGKMWLTNGPPAEIIKEFNFGRIDPAVFRDSADLERMVEMATGALSPASPLNVSPSNSTAAGMSMILSGSIKRSKRTLANISRNLLAKLIEKALWRYIQFDPEQYPAKDYSFIPITTMGLMARELEQQQFVNMLQVVPPNSPPYLIVLKSIYMNSSFSNKGEMLRTLDSMLQPNQQESTMKALEEQSQQSKIQEVKSRSDKNDAQAQALLAKSQQGSQALQIKNKEVDMNSLKELMNERSSPSETS